MTKDDIIDILIRKKKEAIKYSDEWANKPASNSQDKLMNECWSSWNDGQAKAFELAISIVSMLDNPHNRSFEKNKQRITMATIRAYTDISQSKKLAKILPIESADMYYQYVLPKAGKIKHNPEIGNPVNALKWYNKGYTTSGKEPITLDEYCVPCWSLSVLLDVFPYYEINNSGVNIELSVKGEAFITEKVECLLDLAVNMIIHLHELKML